MQGTMDSYYGILETIKRSDRTKGFVLLPTRWVVEGTGGWLPGSRRKHPLRDKKAEGNLFARNLLGAPTA
jgi:transposase